MMANLKMENFMEKLDLLTKKVIAGIKNIKMVNL